jgi:hypothetical protein
MRRLAFRLLPLNCEAGVSPQTAKPQHELVLIEQECQGQSEDSFVQKRGPRRLALATDAAEGWQHILMSTATVNPSMQFLTSWMAKPRREYMIVACGT